MAGEANEICHRDHCDVVDGEDPCVKIWTCEMEDDGGRNEGPEYIDPFGCCT